MASWFTARSVFLIVLTAATVTLVTNLFFLAPQPEENFSKIRAILSRELGPYFLHNHYPVDLDSSDLMKELETENSKYHVEYTLDPALQLFGQKILDQYKPDFGAISVLDAQTGRVLALANTQKSNPRNLNLNLVSMFPAASIFKIVTASAAVDRYNLSPETLISFSGGNWTLNKRDVLSTVHNKWTRAMSIREAFAHSINTVFGKISVERMKPHDLFDYATRFGFNQELSNEIPISPSFFQVPESDRFGLAQVASGYNRITKMSPLHGALISAAIANDGRMLTPYLIDQVTNAQGELIYQGEEKEIGRVMSEDTASKMRDMMRATVLNGTSRKSFRTLASSIFAGKIEIGGKTGSFSCVDPNGKVDWFVGYGLGEDGRKLAVSAITVNLDKWTVKSSYLAQNIVTTYFDLHPTKPSGRRVKKLPKFRAKVAKI